MLNYSKREIGLAVGASALAGYVDATGFLSLGGFFVSFMSGNTTRMAVGLVGVPGEALLAASLIASFVAGVVMGSLLGSIAGPHRRAVVLVVVALVLAAAAAVAALGAVPIAPLLVAAAMGAENATFERNGEVSIGLTYMTGTLVKLGQRIASAIRGGPQLAWVPYACLWCGLVAGAVCGAFVWPVIGLNGLWIASAAALVLSVTAKLIDNTFDAQRHL